MGSDQGRIKITTKAMFNRHWKSIYNYLCVSENYLTDEKNLLKRKSEQKIIEISEFQNFIPHIHLIHPYVPFTTLKGH